MFIESKNNVTHVHKKNIKETQAHLNFKYTNNVFFSYVDSLGLLGNIITNKSMNK